MLSDVVSVISTVCSVSLAIILFSFRPRHERRYRVKMLKKNLKLQFQPLQDYTYDIESARFHLDEVRSAISAVHTMCELDTDLPFLNERRKFLQKFIASLIVMKEAKREYDAHESKSSLFKDRTISINGSQPMKYELPNPYLDSLEMLANDISKMRDEVTNSKFDIN